ncbi:MAG TPA: head GIN domain-containing protein [Longilinea sp.]|nr:head GIN domain-containing protein [Longilinea sp.]
MKKSLIAILLIFTIALSGCTIYMTTGSGTLVEENRSVSNVEAVQFTSVGQLTIVQGDSESLVVEAEDNIISHITTEMEGSTLVIGFDDGADNMVTPTRMITYTLTVTDLHDIELSGAGNISMDELTADDVTIRLSGAGNIDIGTLTATTITVSLPGAGNISINGTVNEEELELSGFGNYNAHDLQASVANVNVSGAGNASVWVTDTLNVGISGAGSVEYYGTPDITQSISGVGVLNSRGNK